MLLANHAHQFLIALQLTEANIYSLQISIHQILFVPLLTKLFVLRHFFFLITLFHEALLKTSPYPCFHPMAK
jgi:hypothetical protein